VIFSTCEHGFTFSRPARAAGAAGEREILIRYAVLDDLLPPDGIVAPIAKGLDQ